MTDPTNPVSADEIKSATGKNLLIEVPDFDTSVDGDQVSYLRLGKFLPADVDPNNATRGGDLVQCANKVGPGDGNGWGVVDDKGNRIAPGNRLFEDDWRTRADNPPSTAADLANPYKTDPKWGREAAGDAKGHKIPVDVRKGRSSKLLDPATPSAGWRDHTEGNRVTTTRGDKVEVIGGNYKLVVLGRNVDASQSSGFDFSGGHVQDFEVAPGTVNEIKWVQDQGGTWKMYEKATKGQVSTWYQGNVYEAFNGDTIKTYVGVDATDLPSELTGGDHMAGNDPGGKPHVAEVMRLKSFDSNVKVVMAYGGSGVHKSELEATELVDIVRADANFTEVVAATTHLVTDNSALVVETLTGARVMLQIGLVAEMFVGGRVTNILGHEKAFVAFKEETALKDLETTLRRDLVAVTRFETNLNSYDRRIRSVETTADDTKTAVRSFANAVKHDVRALEQSGYFILYSARSPSVSLGI